MKTAAIQTLRHKLAGGNATYGLWVTLEAASITEMAVGLGLDWVVIDAEHGHLDWKEVMEQIRATVRSDTVALVRLAELNAGLIKRALDVGADGVVIPWMETAEQLRQAVAFAQYPPRGRRGIGAERATAWGQALAASVAEADEHVLVVPILESVTAYRNVEEMCRVPGVDLFLIGPADYSATAGYPGQWEGPGVAEQILAIKDAVVRQGKHCGIMATSIDNLHQRLAQGFRLLGLGMDGGLLLRSLRGALAAVGRDRPLSPSLIPQAPPPVPPAEAPPADICPNRPEVMNLPAESPQREISPGVVFTALVGGHNRARNLTTGIVTLQPGAALPYHTHPFAESVTVLSGKAAFSVQGRRYLLGPLDNVYVRPEIAHAVVNLSRSEAAVFHIAMSTDTPTRTLIEDRFTPRDMPEDSTGVPGAERVSRHERTPVYEIASGARFQDFFNRDLGCPEMSGGYGRFLPGGRLPCHLHDFDESISIVEGTATCVVEGRRYSLSGNATALVPRGRCHYFINESSEPMAMIWVYAGPMPERVVLAEKCCDARREE